MAKYKLSHTGEEIDQVINVVPALEENASFINYQNIDLQYTNDIVASANAGNYMYRAFDHSDTSYYNPNTTTVPIRLCIDLGFTVIAKKIKIKTVTAVTHFTIDASTDGIEWVTLIGVDNTSADLIEYVLDNTQEYRYYSMNITEVTSASGYVYTFQISEALQNNMLIYNVIPQMSDNVTTHINNYLNINVPFKTYQRGQIVNITMPSKGSDINYQEETFSRNIIPELLSNKYGPCTYGGAPSGSTNLMFDNDTSTHTSGGSKDSEYTAYIGSNAASDGTMFAIKPTQVYVKPTSGLSNSGSNFSIRGYDYNTGVWETLATGISKTSATNVSITTDKYYSKIGLYWTTGSTLAYLNYIDEMQITAGSIIWGKLKATPISIIHNPLLSINNLEPKPINGIIREGSSYGLVYNGESWDQAYPFKKIEGAYSGSGSAVVDLGGRPKFLIVYGASYTIAIVSDTLSKKYVLDHSRNTGTSSTPCYGPGYNGSNGSVTITDIGFNGTGNFTSGSYIAIF